MKTSSPNQKAGAEPPLIFGHFNCGQTAVCIKTPLGMEVASARQLCVRWGPSRLPKRGGGPNFLPYVYCGQTAGWIKMPFSTAVKLGPGYVVLDGYTALLRKGHSSRQLFGPRLLWPQSPISATAELVSRACLDHLTK